MDTIGQPKMTHATIDGLIKVMLDAPHPEGMSTSIVFYDALSREFPNMPFKHKSELCRKFDKFCEAYVALPVDALEYRK